MPKKNANTTSELAYITAQRSVAELGELNDRLTQPRSSQLESLEAAMDVVRTARAGEVFAQAIRLHGVLNNTKHQYELEEDRVPHISDTTVRTMRATVTEYPSGRLLQVRHELFTLGDHQNSRFETETVCLMLPLEESDVVSVGTN